MSKIKIFLSLILAFNLAVIQVGGVFAAPILQNSGFITGIVESITTQTDPNTGMTTVIVTVTDENQLLQNIRLGQQTAERLKLVVPDDDGNMIINQSALGQPVEIDPALVLADQEENRHPIGNALETFFAESIPGLDYETIMTVHDQGIGFGVIAQALWLTTRLDGDLEIFQDLIYAKQVNDYSAFSAFTSDGNAPANWGQLRKAILNGEKKHSLGDVMSNQDTHGNGNNQNNGNPKDKNNNGNHQEKNKDKDNNGKGKEKNK